MYYDVPAITDEADQLYKRVMPKLRRTAVAGDERSAQLSAVIKDYRALAHKQPSIVNAVAYREYLRTAEQYLAELTKH